MSHLDGLRCCKPLEELLCVLVEVVGVILGVGVEVIPVAAVSASTALRASSGASLI